jgi:3-oxoacyl-[acyl-carrier-protein] synthase III
MPAPTIRIEVTFDRTDGDRPTVCTMFDLQVANGMLEKIKAMEDLVVSAVVITNLTDKELRYTLSK